MTRPHAFSALGLLALLVACTLAPPTNDDSAGTASDGTSGDGTSGDGTSQGGTSQGGTSQGGTQGATQGGTDETAGSETGGSADCSYDGGPWTFSDELDMPRMRGVGSGDQTCNPVTTDTIPLELQLDVAGGLEIGPTASLRVLLFEYDPDVADASADCVGGTCEPILDVADLSWSFDVPNDQPMLRYYVAVDLDDGNGCVLHDEGFVTFMPAQGTLVVPMTGSDCI